MRTALRSFELKADRAERHLTELSDQVARYSDSHPYAIRMRREGKKRKPVYRLDITKQPDDVVSLLIADTVYNIRSGLDHLAAALVPARDRDSTMFPVFFQGVWEPPVRGENAQRLKERQRWTTTTRRMHPDAVTFLRSVQPADTTDYQADRIIPAFVLINRLSNTDRHSKIPVVAAHLVPRLLIFEWDGQRFRVPATREFGWTLDALRDGASFDIPDGATEVEVDGAVGVFTNVTDPKWNVEIPSALTLALQGMRNVITGLEPYVR